MAFRSEISWTLEQSVCGTGPLEASGARQRLGEHPCVYSTLGLVLSHANGHIMEPLELSLVSTLLMLELFVQQYYI